MTHSQLTRLLRHCPLFDTFGMPQRELVSNLNRARMLDKVAKLILHERSEPELASVPESDSSREISSRRAHNMHRSEEQKRCELASDREQNSPDESKPAIEQECLVQEPKAEVDKQV